MDFSTRADYGNYDQCLSLDHTYSGGRILGEFCAVGLIIPPIFGNLSDINVSICNNICYIFVLNRGQILDLKYEFSCSFVELLQAIDLQTQCLRSQ